MQPTNLYEIIPAIGKPQPIVVSIPHAGTFIPEEIGEHFLPHMAATQDDTDWFVPTLYHFLPQMGITTIVANYSRWVIDLNRDADNKPLYNDGRVITDVVTKTDFNGQALYQAGCEPNADEVALRTQRYYTPYHEKIAALLESLKESHADVLLFDAHSIRKSVPGISAAPFPDLVLGDNDGKTAASNIITAACNVLVNCGYQFAHNHPFKGGHITRSFGQPSEGIHALQLEMAKTNYMDATETRYAPAKAAKIQVMLRQLFAHLLTEINKMQKHN
ncbi:MAG: N-formylglutamate amidohydrolase [Edaphocola sp.]